MFPDFLTTAQGGGKVVNRKHQPRLPPENAPGTHFCFDPRAIVRAGLFMSTKNSNDTIWDRTSDLLI
jgi:hypothetical protein